MYIIVDFGEPSINNIQLILTKLNKKSIIIKYNDKIPRIRITAIILSGGPNHVYCDNAAKFPIISNSIPVLAICYGMELITIQNNGLVENVGKEIGCYNVYHIWNDPLYKNISNPMKTYLNHTDSVTQIPKGFMVNAITEHGIIAGLTNFNKHYCVMFHPEKYPDDIMNVRIFENFIEICENNTN